MWLQKTAVVVIKNLIPRLSFTICSYWKSCKYNLHSSTTWIYSKFPSQCDEDYKAPMASWKYLKNVAGTGSNAPVMLLTLSIILSLISLPAHDHTSNRLNQVIIMSDQMAPCSCVALVTCLQRCHYVRQVGCFSLGSDGLRNLVCYV